MKGDTEVIVMILLFFAGATLMYFAHNIAASPFFQILIPATVTLSAAFLGAYFAFKLQQKQQSALLKRENLRACAATIAKLKHTWNILFSFNSDFYKFLPDQLKNENEIMMQLSINELIMFRPFKQMKHKVEINSDSLVFLYESSNKGILDSLLLLEFKINHFTESINFRSNYLVDEIHTIIDPFSEEKGRNLTEDEFEELVGKKRTLSLIDYTTSVHEQLQELLEEIPETLELLASSVKEVYPNDFNYSFNFKIPKKKHLIITRSSKKVPN